MKIILIKKGKLLLFTLHIRVIQLELYFLETECENANIHILNLE